MTDHFSDPLEKPLFPDRVHYANGLLLDENDFRAEQAYFRGRLARTLAYLHGFGTVAGLMVDRAGPIAAEDGEDPHVIQVKPGLGIDRLGRLIELTAPYCIRAGKWFAQQDEARLKESYDRSADGGLPLAVVADVFIGFATCGRGMTPAFGVGNVDATDAFASARLRDAAGLQLVLRTEADKDRVTQRPPAAALPPIDPADPPDFGEAVALLRQFKLTQAWRESTFWDVNTDTIDKGPEYGPDQAGTEILLARLRLPATADPMTYDTNGQIEIDNAVRVISYATYELLWLFQATRGDAS